MKQKLVALLLMVACLIGIVGYAPVSAKTPKISKKTLTLKVGQSKTLKLKNVPKKAFEDGLVWWISDSPKVAEVDDSGKVTGKKKGTTTVSAIYNGKTYDCKVTVKKKKSSSKTKVALVNAGRVDVKMPYSYVVYTIDRSRYSFIDFTDETKFDILEFRALDSERVTEMLEDKTFKDKSKLTTVVNIMSEMVAERTEFEIDGDWIFEKQDNKEYIAYAKFKYNVDYGVTGAVAISRVGDYILLSLLTSARNDDTVISDKDVASFMDIVKSAVISDNYNEDAAIPSGHVAYNIPSGWRNISEDADVLVGMTHYSYGEDIKISLLCGYSLTMNTSVGLVTYYDEAIHKIFSDEESVKEAHEAIISGFGFDDTTKFGKVDFNKLSDGTYSVSVDFKSQGYYGTISYALVGPYIVIGMATSDRREIPSTLKVTMKQTIERATYVEDFSEVSDKLNEIVPIQG